MISSLSNIGQQLTSILDLDRLLMSILDLAIENVHAERGVIYLHDEVSGSMRPHSARGVAGQQLEHTPLSRSVLQEASQGRSIVTLDVGQDPQLAGIKSLIVQKVKSILCVPMKSRGRVVGVVYLDTQKTTQLFGEKERAFIESFASQAAVAIENARLFGEIQAENSRLRREVQGRVEGLVGSSPPMQRLAATLSTLSNTDATILLTGESGTGKGVVARAIHSSSRRQKGPFVTVDCGSLPDNLLEAELFGFRRGAFTGAERDRRGLFEEANGGTLFLDEVANMSLALQKRLLRVLQEREIRRLGENEVRRIDVRIVAATNGDLRKLVAQERFREDLFYRLNVVGVELPPLRDRLEDLELLVEHFLRDAAPAGSSPKRLAPGVLRALASHDWPGNVRELQNAIARLVAVAQGDIILPDHLPDHFRDQADVAGPSDAAARAGQSPPRTRFQGGSPFKTGEQQMIEDALRRFSGDKSKAARFIGWNRQKLYRRMRAYRIPTRLGRKAA
jgi:Nif-specific regulatory protein